jgi:CRP-like cAMP-binding protein
MRRAIRFSTIQSRTVKPKLQIKEKNLAFPVKRHMSSTNNSVEHQNPNFLREIMLTPRTIPVPRWISPQYHTITLSEICGHSSFILVAFSYAVDDFLQLRLIAVAGSAVMLCFTYFHPHGRVLWLPFKWNALFIAINAYRIGKVYLDRYLANQLSEEMIKIRDEHFYILDPPDFARLVRIGKVETFKTGDLLVEQGKSNAYVRLVIDGEFTVYRDGKLTYKIENGNFISEVGLHAGLLLPGKVVSCCSIVASKPGRTLCWERNELTALLRREKQLRRALKAAISWDIIRKLKGQRKLLQTTIPEIEDPAEWTNRRSEQNHHRYTAILQNMLAHPKYLKERKEELEKYRVIHHIGDEQHAKALAVNGWSIEDFERGYKEGAEYEEETENNFQAFLKDLYFRIFG